MAEFTLETQPREITGKKVKTLRRQGLVPISLYGPKIEPMALQVPYRILEILLRDAGGTNLVDVVVEGKKYLSLAREVQRDILLQTIKHVDFFAVDEDATLIADVPVQLVGESPAVTVQRGVLMAGASSLTVEMLPRDLIHVIEVDLSNIQQIGDAIHVSDLDLGGKVTILNEPEELLARVNQSSAARAEEMEAADEAAAGGAEPEVIARGKAEEEF